MTLESYRVHVEYLWHEVNRAKFYAETTGQVIHWDWFHRATAKAKAAERYLRKREAKEARRMNPWADIYPDQWTPPCPHEEQAAEEWKEYQERKELKA